MGDYNDFFLDNDNCGKRLFNEWRKYKSLIVAVDFDNTLYDFHDEGHKYDDVINLIRRCKNTGAKIVIFTCRTSENYSKIEEYLNENDIPFDAINENLLEGFTGRKIYYNVLLDDRAGLRSAYESLDWAEKAMRLFPDNYDKCLG